MAGTAGTEAEIRVRLQPRARSEEVAGERGGAIVVRVTEPPVEGRANEALRKLIAKRVGVAKSRVQIVRGAASRDKVVRVQGIEDRELESALLGR
jgi:hypothetical protein